MDGGPTGLEHTSQASKQQNQHEPKQARGPGLYLEKLRLADADDTGICDAVGKQEPKVANRSVLHRDGWLDTVMRTVRANICITAEMRLKDYRKITAGQP